MLLILLYKMAGERQNTCTCYHSKRRGKNKHKWLLSFKMARKDKKHVVITIQIGEKRLRKHVVIIIQNGGKMFYAYLSKLR